MKKCLLIVVLCFALPLVAFAGRTITLPHTELFSTEAAYSDIVWIEGTSTHTFLSTGGWDGNGCAKFTPPTRDADNVASLGWFAFTGTSRVNLRFLVYFGTTWASTAAAGAEGYGNKFAIMTGPSNRPWVSLLRCGSECNSQGYHHFGFCAANDTSSAYSCEQDGEWPQPDDVNKLYNGSLARDFAGKWLSVELEATVNGAINVYVYDREGTVSGIYAHNTHTGGGSISGVQLIGGYYNQYHTGTDANTYMLLDDVVISTSYIGPPTGFVGGTTPIISGCTIQGGSVR